MLTLGSELVLFRTGTIFFYSRRFSKQSFYFRFCTAYACVCALVRVQSLDLMSKLLYIYLNVVPEIHHSTSSCQDYQDDLRSWPQNPGCSCEYAHIRKRGRASHQRFQGLLQQAAKFREASLGISTIDRIKLVLL